MDRERPGLGGGYSRAVSRRRRPSVLNRRHAIILCDTRWAANLWVWNGPRFGPNEPKLKGVPDVPAPPDPRSRAATFRNVDIEGAGRVVLHYEVRCRVYGVRIARRRAAEPTRVTHISYQTSSGASRGAARRREGARWSVASRKVK